MSAKFLDSWTEAYLSFLLDVQKKSPRTIIDARCTLRRVMCFFGGACPGLPLWEISFQQFLKWIEHEREKGISPTSLNKDLSHIRSLINFALRSGKCDHNVLDGFHLQDAKPNPVTPKFLELDEMRTLIERLPRKSLADRKNRMLVLLLYGCGLRTSELRNLDVGDVDLERQEIFIRLGKGSMERRIPVPGAV